MKKNKLLALIRERLISCFSTEIIYVHDTRQTHDQRELLQDQLNTHQYRKDNKNANNYYYDIYELD